MTRLSEMELSEVREYVKKADSCLLLEELEDIFQFDIARLPVGYMYPRHYLAVKYELLRRLGDTEAGTTHSDSVEPDTMSG